MTSGAGSQRLTVLVAIDGTSASDHAALVARSLFDESARYVLLNVGRSDGDGPALLDEAAAQAGFDDAVELVADGDVAAAILRTAHEREADAIVLGWHERGWFSRLIDRPTSRHVTDAAEVPVLVVKERALAAKTASGNTVMIATDGGPASLAAARAAVSLFGSAARYETVHVAADRPDPNVDIDGMAGPLMSEAEADALGREAMAIGADAVAATAREVAPTPVTETVLVGDPALTLCDRGRESAADVLVVGSTRGSRLLHVLLGSVSAHAVAECDAPVLVVPPVPSAG